MELTHITPVLAAGAAALAIVAAPTAAAEPAAAQITNPSTAVVSEVVPAGFHGGGLPRRWLPRWLSRWIPRQSLRLGPPGLEPVGLGSTLLAVNSVGGSGITRYRFRLHFCLRSRGGLLLAGIPNGCQRRCHRLRKAES